MWIHPAVVVLLLSLSVGLSVPTSDSEVSPSNLEVSPGDPEVSSGDPEVSSGDPTMAPERRLGAKIADDEDKKQPKHVLPTNKQVSAFLPGRQYKRFLYRQEQDGAAISLVVTPCSADLVGNITFQPDTIKEGGKRHVQVKKFEGPGQVIYSARRGESGNYDVNIAATSDTYVHFLATDEDLAGLGSLQTQVRVKNRSKSRAEISWSPGSHGGQALRYCLITSPTRHFSSMCGGLSAKFGQQPPGNRSARLQQMSPPPRRQRAVQNGNITVGCVGKATVYTLYDLFPGRRYYVTVFGQYLNRSVSFQYGTKEFRYQDRSVRTSLRIRQNRPLQLRLSPSRPFRRLQLRGPSEQERLHYFVVSCGGPLSMRMLSSYSNTGWPDRPVQSQGFPVPNGVLIRSELNTSRLASEQDEYQFELTATGGATAVEFQATWRRGRLRVASLPGRPRVRPAGQRHRSRLGLDCTQLALRMPRARGRRLEYCVLLELDTSGRTGRRFKRPSACGLASRLHHSPANMTRCGTSRKLRRGRRVEVIFDGLIPGQSYVTRAMVRPQKGRFVPYHLSQVTLPPCPDELPNELTEGNIGGSEPISAPGSGGRQEFEQVGVRRTGLGPTGAEARAEAVEEAHNTLNDWTT